MRHLFRWGGILCFVVGVISRLNARSILPSSYSWSGDFADSQWGVLLAGFGDVMNVVALLGGIAFLASFTNLFDDQKRRSFLDPTVSPESAEGDEAEPTECMACGEMIPPGQNECPKCGWTYKK